MSAYDDIFEQASKASNVPVELLRAVASAESNMDPKAVSKDAKGNPIARGLMQLTDDTAKGLGVTDPHDPKQAIPAAAKLLRANLDASNGDEKQALMMYHGGPDESNWGPKTKAYPNAVYNAQAKLAKDSAGSSDPVYAFLNGSAAKQEPAAESKSSGDAVFDFLNSGGKVQEPAQVSKKAATGLSDQIPGAPSLAGKYAASSQQSSEEPSLLEKAIGVGQTAASALSAIPASIPAGIGALYNIATNGKYGTPEGANEAERVFTRTMQERMYQPSTPTGQAYAEKLGNMMQAVPPVLPEIGAVATMGKAAAPQISNALTDALKGSRKLEEIKLPTPPVAGPPGAMQVPNRLQPLVKVNPDGTVTRLGQEGAPTPAPVATEVPPAINPAIEALNSAKPRFKLNADGSVTPLPAPGMNEPPIEFNTPKPPVAAPEAASPTPKPTAEEPLPPPISEPPIKFENASPELKKIVEDAQQKGKPINQEALNRHLEADSLPVKMQISKGQATGDVNLLSEEQNNRGKNPESAEFFNRQNKDLVDNTNAIKAAAAPDVHVPTQEAAGEALIKSGAAQLAEDHANISALYKKMEAANGGSFPVNGADIVKALESNPKWKMKGRYVTPEIKSLLADMKASKTAMTFDDFEALRTTLAEDMRTAARNGNGNTRYALGMVREAAENLPMKGATAEVKAMADAARQANAKFHAKLESDPALSAIENDTARPDNFVNKYVVLAKRREAKALKDNLSADPEAKQVLSAAMVNHLKEAAGLKNDLDNFSQNGYRGALKKQGSKIDDLLPPEQAQQVRTLGNVAAYTQRQPRGSYVNNSNTLVGKLANTAANAAEGAANYVAHGVPVGSYIRGKLVARAEKNRLMESLKPGAGIEEKK